MPVKPTLLASFCLVKVLTAMVLQANRYAQGGKKRKQKIFQPICWTSQQTRFKFFGFQSVTIAFTAKIMVI
jgi:hypothetical protein